MSFAKPIWLKAGIALALLSNWILVAAASEVRTLKNIEVFPLKVQNRFVWSSMVNLLENH